MDEEQKGSALTSVADGIGTVIEGLFYCVGRASPMVADAAQAVSNTRAGQHVVHHAHVGWTKGWNATILAREKRKRRQIRSRWGDGVRQGARVVKEGVKELVDMVHEDLDAMRGEGPQLKPVPGE